MHQVDELDLENGMCENVGRCGMSDSQDSADLIHSNDSSDLNHSDKCSRSVNSNDSSNCRNPANSGDALDSNSHFVASDSPDFPDVRIELFEGPNRVDPSPPQCLIPLFVSFCLDFEDLNLPSFNFSLVCVVDRSTLFTLSHLEQMWPGPISVAVLAPVNESQFMMLSSRTRIAVVHTSLPKSLNYLRNVAINNTRTTHFLVIDSGTLVDVSLHSVLQSLPSSLLAPSTALILPLFFVLPSSSSSSSSSSS